MDSLGKAFECRAGRAFIVMPEHDRQVVASKIASDWSSPRYLHGLIEAVHLAFSEHRPLILSPDSIWLVIAQGFGHHVNENAELLRSRMVAHAGKRLLTVKSSDYADAISGLSAQVCEFSDPVLHETLVCDFSTTTPTIRAASEVVLLDTYQRYFEYHMRFICGIPEITLEGTCEDWQRIRARVEVLATYGLEWWVTRLRPILDEFVRTAEGQPHREFWKAIYKPAQAYGTRTVTGWVADLFPYLEDPPIRRKNPVFAATRVEWSVTKGEGVPPTKFPSGLSRAPVKCIFPDGSTRNDALMAGFFAVGQNPGDNALYPVISWSVAESDAVEKNWDALAQQFPTEPKAPDVQALIDGRPLELIHFADRYACMDLRLANSAWRIVPSFLLDDEDGKPWTCFAYNFNRAEGGKRAKPNQVLALERERLKANPRAFEQVVYVCDLRPDYDLLQPPQEPRKSRRFWKLFKGAKQIQSPEGLAEPDIVRSRRLEGDLFTFLFALIAREGKLD